MSVTNPTQLPLNRTNDPNIPLPPDITTRWSADEANAVFNAIRDRSTFRGVWGVSTQYRKNDLIVYNSILWNAIDDNIGSAPPSASWEILATSVTNYLIGSNPDSQSAVAAYTDNTIPLTLTGAKLLSIRNGGTELAYVDKDGLIYGAGGLASGAGVTSNNGYFAAAGGTTSFIQASVADGASAVTNVINNTIALTTSGSKLLSIRNNGVEKAYVGYDGLILGSALYAGVSGNGVVYGGNFVPATSTNQQVSGRATNSAAAVAVKIANINSLTVSGGKIASFYSDNGVSEKASIDIFGKHIMDATDASGTPGSTTINKPSGQVAMAAGASTLTVTNSTVSSTSVVLCTIQANDTTFTYIKSVAPGIGSFTITGNAAATANTKIGFVVFN